MPECFLERLCQLMWPPPRMEESAQPPHPHWHWTLTFIYIFAVLLRSIWVRAEVKVEKPQREAETYPRQ